MSFSTQKNFLNIPSPRPSGADEAKKPISFSPLKSYYSGILNPRSWTNRSNEKGNFLEELISSYPTTSSGGVGDGLEIRSDQGNDLKELVEQTKAEVENIKVENDALKEKVRALDQNEAEIKKRSEMMLERENCVINELQGKMDMVLVQMEKNKSEETQLQPRDPTVNCNINIEDIYKAAGMYDLRKQFMEMNAVREERNGFRDQVFNIMTDYRILLNRMQDYQLVNSDLMERLQLIFEQEQDSNQKALTYEDELIDTRERLAMAVTIAEQYEYEISEYQDYVKYLKSELLHKNELLIAAKYYVDRIKNFEEQPVAKPAIEENSIGHIDQDMDKMSVGSLSELKSNVNLTIQLLQNTLKAHTNLQREFSMITKNVDEPELTLMQRDPTDSLGTVYEKLVSENARLKELLALLEKEIAELKIPLENNGTANRIADSSRNISEEDLGDSPETMMAQKELLEAHADISEHIGFHYTESQELLPETSIASAIFEEIYTHSIIEKQEATGSPKDNLVSQFPVSDIYSGTQDQFPMKTERQSSNQNDEDRIRDQSILQLQAINQKVENEISEPVNIFSDELSVKLEPIENQLSTGNSKYLSQDSSMLQLQAIKNDQENDVSILIEEFEKEMKSRTEENRELLKTVREQSETIIKLQNDNETIMEKANSFKLESEDAQRSQSQLFNDELLKLEREVISLEQIISAKDEELKRYQQQISDLQAVNENISSEINEIVNELKEKENTLKLLRDQQDQKMNSLKVKIFDEESVIIVKSDDENEIVVVNDILDTVLARTEVASTKALSDGIANTKVSRAVVKANSDHDANNIDISNDDCKADITDKFDAANEINEGDIAELNESKIPIISPREYAEDIFFSASSIKQKDQCTSDEKKPIDSDRMRQENRQLKRERDSLIEKVSSLSSAGKMLEEKYLELKIENDELKEQEITNECNEKNRNVLASDMIKEMDALLHSHKEKLQEEYVEKISTIQSQHDVHMKRIEEEHEQEKQMLDREVQDLQKTIKKLIQEHIIPNVEGHTLPEYFEGHVTVKKEPVESIPGSHTIASALKTLNDQQSSLLQAPNTKILSVTSKPNKISQKTFAKMPPTLDGRSQRAERLKVKSDRERISKPETLEETRSIIPQELTKIQAELKDNAVDSLAVPLKIKANKGAASNSRNKAKTKKTIQKQKNFSCSDCSLSVNDKTNVVELVRICHIIIAKRTIYALNFGELKFLHELVYIAGLRKSMKMEIFQYHVFDVTDQKQRIERLEDKLKKSNNILKELKR